MLSWKCKPNTTPLHEAESFLHDRLFAICCILSGTLLIYWLVCGKWWNFIASATVRHTVIPSPNPLVTLISDWFSKRDHECKAQKSSRGDIDHSAKCWNGCFPRQPRTLSDDESRWIPPLLASFSPPACSSSVPEASCWEDPMKRLFCYQCMLCPHPHQFVSEGDRIEVCVCTGKLDSGHTALKSGLDWVGTAYTSVMILHLVLWVRDTGQRATVHEHKLQAPFQIFLGNVEAVVINVLCQSCLHSSDALRHLF